MEKELCFEEAMAGLEKAAEGLRQNNSALEDALLQYETGVKYYDRCMEILNTAKQRIEIYDKQLGKLREF